MNRRAFEASTTAIILGTTLAACADKPGLEPISLNVITAEQLRENNYETVVQFSERDSGGAVLANTQSELRIAVDQASLDQLSQEAAQAASDRVDDFEMGDRQSVHEEYGNLLNSVNYNTVPSPVSDRRFGSSFPAMECSTSTIEIQYVTSERNKIALATDHNFYLVGEVVCSGLLQREIEISAPVLQGTPLRANRDLIHETGMRCTGQVLSGVTIRQGDLLTGLQQAEEVYEPTTTEMDCSVSSWDLLSDSDRYFSVDL